MLGEEAAECCAFVLGGRAVLSDHCLHTFGGYSERAGRSQKQVFHHICHRQSECH